MYSHNIYTCITYSPHPKYDGDQQQTNLALSSNANEVLLLFEEHLKGRIQVCGNGNNQDVNNHENKVNLLCCWQLRSLRNIIEFLIILIY